MILHDNTFEDLAKAPVKHEPNVVVARRALDEFGDMNDDGLITWQSGDFIMEVKIDVVGEMLGSITKKATIKLMEGVNLDLLKIGDLFQIRLGLYNNDPSVSGYNYISEGYYLVDEITIDGDAGFVTITMYDHMWKAGNTLYTQAGGLSQLTYPISVYDFATEVASILNVELDADFVNLPNQDYMIAEDLYSLISTATLKNVINDIAGATGSTARMTDFTLNFHSYEVESESLTTNNLKKLKIGETYGPITSLALTRPPVTEGIAINAIAPSNNVITGIDTTTNLFTLPDHGFEDPNNAGNLIQFETTGTLPAPLQLNTSYYVYANGDPDTFKLAPTYLDAVNGTNLIDITTTGAGDLIIPTLTTRSITIMNNEILDDDRTILIGPLYNALSGLEWTGIKADTTGLGYFEAGDVVEFTYGGVTVKGLLSEVHLTIDGGIKEQLISNVPTSGSINYAAAGGITRTIYNTEIKVDRQNQEITSVVSRQDTLEGIVNENFTEVSQDVDDVLITIQRAGGGNILYNSVGFAKEQFRDTADMSYDKLLYWTYPDPYTISTDGTATSYQSSDSQAAGGISGQVIELKGDMIISQRVAIAAGIPLCFALMVKNTIGTGGATITLTNDTDSFSIVIDDLATYNWQEFKIENFKATLPWFDIVITADSSVKFLLTDLRLMYGATTQGWVQANGEILSANVQFTTDGVRVFDSVHDTETRMTFNEFSTRRKSDNEILFEADDLGVVTNNLSIKGRTSYIRDGDTIIKQITVGSANPKAGLAFIKVVE